MKDITVAELIEKLKALPPNAIACRYIDDPDLFSSIEVVKAIENARYLDYKGDELIGQVCLLA